MKRVNLAIVGATGMVGRTFLKVLEERKFPINNLYLFSSEKSAGTELVFRGRYSVIFSRGRCKQEVCSYSERPWSYSS